MLPLPPRQKEPVPAGYTGYTGVDPEPERMATSWAKRPNANICLRCPAGVVGLDLDGYKPGAVDRHRRFEALAGVERPASWRSSARPDLEHPVHQERSGIFLYRLPDGVEAPDIAQVFAGCDVIRRAHRWVVVWPSVHPDGGVYRWYGPGGQLVDRPPGPGDLPVLPAEWVVAAVRLQGNPVLHPKLEGSAAEEGTAPGGRGAPVSGTGGWDVSGPGSGAAGGRHGRLVDEAVRSRRAGLPEAEALAAVEALAAEIKPEALNPAAGGRPSEAGSAVRWAYSKVEPDAVLAAARSADGVDDSLVWIDAADPEHDWYHGIHDDRLLAACVAGVGWDLRYNIRAQRVEAAAAGRDWQPTSDRLEALLFQTIRRRCRNRQIVGWQVSEQGGEDVPVLGWKRLKWGGPAAANRKEAWDSLCQQREVDPFLLWLEELPAWDGQGRLDDLFELAGFELAEGTDVGLACYAARLPFLAAVKRALDPGAKYDLVTVVIGPQGCGKSGFYEESVPPERLADWFGDSLNLAASDQKKLEASSGKVINEAADIAGMRFKDLEALKQWVSIRVDYIRRPWRRNSEAEPRRGVIVGTSNDRAALPGDPTGNRRFVAVEAVSGSRAAVNVFWAACRDQVWAEALHRVRAGEQLYLSDRAARAQAAAVLEYQASDSETAGYLNWYLSTAEWDVSDGVSEAEVITRVKQPLDPDPPSPAGRDYQLNPYRVRKQLTEWGWQRRRVTVAGRRLMRWFPPPGGGSAVGGGVG